MSKVSTLLDAGQQDIKDKDYDFTQISYLIFDLANSNIRHHLEQNLNNTFKLKSLHNICVGINQLHTAKIAHQDLKPSNILIYKEEISKIADLGRAICHDIKGPHQDYPIPGDPKYAPPELHYGYSHPELIIRIYCTDLYLLGSLIAFYFTGYSMNAILKDHLHPMFHYSNWNGTYQDLLPYLEAAFIDAVNTIGNEINPNSLSIEIKQLLVELCTPNIEKRGTNTIKMGLTNRYSVYKYINRINVLYRKSYYGTLI